MVRTGGKVSIVSVRRTSDRFPARSAIARRKVHLPSPKALGGVQVPPAPFSEQLSDPAEVPVMKSEKLSRSIPEPVSPKAKVRAGVALLTISPSAGLATERVGGTESTTMLTGAEVPRLPERSAMLARKSCVPSAKGKSGMQVERPEPGVQVAGNAEMPSVQATVAGSTPSPESE